MASVYQQPPPYPYSDVTGTSMPPHADPKGMYEQQFNNQGMQPQQIAPSWEAVANNSAWRGQLSLVYTAQTPGAPSYFVSHRKDGHLSIHRGVDDSGPELGRVSVRSKWSTKTEFTFPSPSNNGQQQLQPFTQTLDESGIIHKAYACRLPAVDALGAFRWVRTKDYGSKRLRDTSRALTDEHGRDVAAFVRAGCFSGATGTLKILRADLSPLAVDQVVVACIAMEELHRIVTRNTTIAVAAAS